MVIGCGNLGARPQPPLAASNEASIAPAAAASSSGVGSSTPASSRDCSTSPWTSRPPAASTSAALLAPGTIDALEHLAERRHPVARLVRVVGAAVERTALGGQEDRHRPATATGHRLDRRHVDLVEVGPLLAVDLDRHEPVVQVARRRLVLERLALHHVAPVTGRVADRQEDRPVQQLRPGEGVGTPRKPVDRVVRVLEEVGAGLPGEAICHAFDGTRTSSGAPRHQKRAEIRSRQPPDKVEKVWCEGVGRSNLLSPTRRVPFA